MKVPWSWLSEYCDTGLEPADLAERMAMTGTEVERVVEAGIADAGPFVVGRVVSVEPHPNADRLRVCQVDDGTGTRTIVCGAPNVDAGQAVIVALPGAIMPGGMEIGETELRGVLSSGMICGPDEIGVGERTEGILVLDGDPTPGTPASEVVPIEEVVLELEVTPNRTDCFGIYGVAREAHAITGASLAGEPWSGWDPGTDDECSDVVSVSVEDPADCLRFTARVFTGVQIGDSPAWLQARLIASGQRPINNVVDITNYVMLLTGQPLHAFDLDLVPGGELVVRRSRPGEGMTTLDGVERDLPEGTVLVCDRNGPAAIAGIMGGSVSEVGPTTDSVLLEVATWDGPGILRTSRELGLRSEASSRFEKQLHPALCDRAQAVAARLMAEVCGATEVPGMVDVFEHRDPERTLELRSGSVERVLGMDVPVEEQLEALDRLGFSPRPSPDGIEVTVPPDRHFDVTREIDLVEEVARISDLDTNLPATLPSGEGHTGGLSREQQAQRRTEDAMRESGFDEVVGWSFTSPDRIGALRLGESDQRSHATAISNPLSEEQSVMRTTVLISLLEIASRNLARGIGSVRIFESGRVYLPGGRTGEGLLGGAFPGGDPAPLYEPQVLGALATGEFRPGTWASPSIEAGFFPMKGVLEHLAGDLGLSVDVIPGAEPFLHPGRSGQVTVEGIGIGWIGEIHPLVARAFEVPSAVAFEIRLADLASASSVGDEVFREIPAHPAVERDIAILMPEEVAVSAVASAIGEAGGDLLEDVALFDVYAGEELPDGRRSLAFRLRFRAVDRTLAEEDVKPAWDAIVASIGSLKGELRG
jgi:phenylalanyl-tRNA synthetase beta chain